MKLSKLLEGLEPREIHAPLDMEISSLCYDSRKAAPGCAFAAIVGFETDGHKYIASAAEKGASVVLCQKAPEHDIPYVLFDDTRYALAIASRNYFGNPASEMKLIGITGTNGKTTTTMLIKHMLEECLGAKVGLIGTNQDMIGDDVIPTERTTPESFELQQLFRQMADEGCSHVVMEVSSHSLELERVAGVTFEVGAFTNLTQDHLDFHVTMENYCLAKAKLFSQSKKGVVNFDDDWSYLILEKAQCPVVTFSAERNEADLVAKDIKLSAQGVKFCALVTGELRRVSLGIPGRFSVYNALAVIACGMQLGLTMEECVRALSTATGVKGRVEVVPTDGDYTMLIDYAHTPDALENVLNTVKEVSSGRVVVLFGCGGDRDKTKRPIMGRIAADKADMVIVTSDNPRTEDPDAIISDILEGMKDTSTPYEVIPDRRHAIAYSIDNHLPGDIIVLAGKGHETYQIIGKTKYHMDEREIVSEHLEKRKKI